jgi:hypothetical protein
MLKIKNNKCKRRITPDHIENASYHFLHSERVSTSS